MKISAIRISLLAACVALQANAFPGTDPFDRPDTAARDGGWGDGWRIEGGPVFIQDHAGKKQSGGKTVAIESGSSLPDGPFRVSAEFYVQAKDRWAGLVFHYASQDDYRVWRVKFTDGAVPWQLCSVRDGKLTIVQEGTIFPSADLPEPAPLKSWRRLEVERGGDGGYSVRLRSVEDGGPPGWSARLNWNGGGGGLAGLALDNGFVWTRNFTAEVP